MISASTDQIFGLKREDFHSLAMEIFHFQYLNNSLYRSYSDALGVLPQNVKSSREIPFLPIGFFKTHTVQATSFDPEIIFESSGTTQTTSSLHYVKESETYQRSFTEGFERLYGPVEDWCIIGLLPSYLERARSSLVYMVNGLIKRSGHPKSGFYLYNHEELWETIQVLETQRQKTILIGVTFALLDFSQKFRMNLKHTIVMETGGMKGRSKEIIRPQIHQLLKKRLRVESIHSEYGMTELLSQAYSKSNGIFETPPWMRVFIRDENDPLDVQENGPGILNVIDLANIYSCPFLATDDVGKIYPDGTFEVLGRLDKSDLRGCNLLVT